jgi:hypothetical protein
MIRIRLYSWLVMLLLRVWVLVHRGGRRRRLLLSHDRLNRCRGGFRLGFTSAQQADGTKTDEANESDTTDYTADNSTDRC